jgi:hypothetical protein
MWLPISLQIQDDGRKPAVLVTRKWEQKSNQFQLQNMGFWCDVLQEISRNTVRWQIAAACTRLSSQTENKHYLLGNENI